MNRMNQLACKAMCKMHTQKGVTMIEYVLIASLISIIGIVAITAIGAEIGQIWEDIKTALGA
jgi:Flp pilus assembly pilin Flp